MIRNNGLMAVAVAVIVFLLVLAGCTAVQYEVVEIPLKDIPVETVKLHFKRPFIAKAPGKNPVTAEDHICCGHFYFEQERFAEAAEEFEKARLRISEPQNSLYRACLISTAVCHLLTDNRTAFIETIRELKTTFNRYELLIVAKRDERVKALFSLYDEFIKTRNF